MYCYRRGNGQKPTLTKPRTKTSSNNWDRICTGDFCPRFFTRPTKSGGVRDVWRTFWGSRDVWQSVTGGGGSKLKLAKNSVTYFMDGPYVQCRIRPFPHKNHYFRKEFLYDTFFYSVRIFARIRQHYFSKHWGKDAWAVPLPQILGGPSPQPPRSPPLGCVYFEVCCDQGC